ncbi:hypothetical protein [Candidatus Ichthyocystis hellenicum]|uniref:hypothetical protein n=1 Tax=Candidatus Ichthyocystis hellenicum TaxID=1561003 RepID=UPI000B8704DF|nr:hypothetical protein [Candidatus Ichthyocystis hellenicum]
MDVIYAPGSQYYIFRDTCDENFDDILGDVGSTLPSVVGDTDLLAAASSVRCELPVEPVPVKLRCSSLNVKLNKYINDMWGINLHPDDNKIILFIRRKFSLIIRNHLRESFSSMLKDGFILPSGNVIIGSSWNFISDELFPIAVKSVEMIMEEQYIELGKFIPKARVVDTSEGDIPSYVVRKVTDDEKNNLMNRAKSIVAKRLRNSIRLSWIDVTKIPIKHSYKDINERHVDSSLGVGIRYGDDHVLKIRHSDDMAIFSTRRKFSCRMSKCISSKFCEMIKSKYKFEDGTVIDTYPWIDVSKKLLPVAKKEIEPIMERERVEINDILLKSRAMFSGHSGDTITRELTSKEVFSILEKVMESVSYRVISSLSRLWKNVIKLLEKESSNGSSVVVNTGSKDDGSMVSLCREDDNAIRVIRSIFSREINKCIGNKFSEMIRKGYRLEDGTALVVHHWMTVSKKLNPIVRKEIKPIIERERLEISRLLSESRTVFSKPDGTNLVRELTSRERYTILETTMRSVYESAMCGLWRVWGRVVKSLVEKSSGLHDSSASDSGTSEFGIGCLSSGGLINISEVYINNISTVERKFSTEIIECIRNKFCEMLKVRHNFEDGTIIDISPWKDVSKKLLPIIKKEIYPILERERVELNKVLLKSRVVVFTDGGCSSTDREPTPEEISNSLESIMRRVYKRSLFFIRNVWGNIIKLQGGFYNTEFYRPTDAAEKFEAVEFGKEFSSPLHDIRPYCGSELNYSNSKFRVELSKIDSTGVLSVRREFSAEIVRCIRNKFCEMLKNGYKFEDNTTIDVSPWRNISKRLLPVVKKTVDPIVEKELIEVKKVLSESMVTSYSVDGSSIAVRKITSEEVSYFMKKIMECIHERFIITSMYEWRLITKSPEEFVSFDGPTVSKILESNGCFSSLMRSIDMDALSKAELYSIRLEFIGVLGSIVCELTNSFPFDNVPSPIPDDIYHVAYKRSEDFFRDSGFFVRLEALLASALLIGESGKERALTDSERSCFFKMFMDSIDNDRYYLIKKRTEFRK